jgi:hypothetical protein
MKEQKGGETEAFGEIPHECRDVNHRSHKTWPGIDPGR